MGNKEKQNPGKIGSKKYEKVNEGMNKLSAKVRYRLFKLNG